MDPATPDRTGTTTAAPGIGGGVAGPGVGWRPARKFPQSYPGPCPEDPYLLHNSAVLPLAPGPDGYDVVLSTGAREPVDAFLRRHGSPPLARRYPVLAYGANRNPATLEEKLRNYHYVSDTGDRCLPVLRGTLSDADVAACGLHGQGYFYGELLLGGPFGDGVTLDVRVALVDADQLRVLNDSEGLRAGLYTAARIPGVRVPGRSGTLAPIGYVSNARVWVSPRAGAPLGFRHLVAADRRIPALDSPQIVDHALDVLGLRSQVSAITGLADDDHLGRELTKYLNGQWWYQFNTADVPIAGYSAVLELFGSAMAGSLLNSRTLDHLDARGLVLRTERAYHPDPALLFGPG